MPIENNLASDLQLIVPNLHRRYSGVTATNRLPPPRRCSSGRTRSVTAPVHLVVQVLHRRVQPGERRIGAGHVGELPAAAHEREHAADRDEPKLVKINDKDVVSNFGPCTFLSKETVGRTTTRVAGCSCSSASAGDWVWMRTEWGGILGLAGARRRRRQTPST